MNNDLTGLNSPRDLIPTGSRNYTVNRSSQFLEIGKHSPLAPEHWKGRFLGSLQERTDPWFRVTEKDSLLEPEQRKGQSLGS